MQCSRAESPSPNPSRYLHLKNGEVVRIFSETAIEALETNRCLGGNKIDRPAKS